MTDPFDLERFVDAQARVYPDVVSELRQGRKQSHWMWFIFPQLAGLGNSAMAQRYALSSRDEAMAFLGHAILGPRLRECTALVNAVEGRTIRRNPRQSRRPQIPFVDDAVRRGVIRAGIRRGDREILRRHAGRADAGAARRLTSLSGFCRVRRHDPEVAPLLQPCGALVAQQRATNLAGIRRAD